MIKKAFGFSLVEVVLALGITGVALLAIFAMFSLPLQSTSAITEQQEALGIAHALPGWLGNQSFSTVYNLVQSSAPTTGMPSVFAFSAPLAGGTASFNAAAGVVICSGTDPTASTSINAKQGRLFGIYFSLSRNYPLESTGGTIVNPTTSSLNNFGGVTAYLSGNTNAAHPCGNPALAVTASIYTLPSMTSTPSKTNPVPVLTYDIIVPAPPNL